MRRPRRGIFVRWLAGVAVAIAASGVAPARAGEGVVEINQTCAETTGCAPGDAPGFPVEIAFSGSYRLTSRLFSAVTSQPVIRADVPYVTLDLNGFGVHQAGPSDPGGGGIVGGSHVTVKNGFVTDAANDGIRLGADARVLDVEVSNNKRDGVNVQGESIVRGVVASSNDNNGITAGFASTVDGCTATYNDADGIYLNSGSLTRSTATQNVGRGAYLGPKSSYAANYFESNASGDSSGGHASGGNHCGDGSCTSDGRKRFHLSRNAVIASQAPSECSPGFHMAALSEISNPSSLHYDFTRGQTSENDDSRGIPSVQGWIRSVDPGYSSSNFAGHANCFGYQSAAATDKGTTLYLNFDWSQAATTGSPWVAAAQACNQQFAVWCVED
jgi:hypothetical protein